MKKQLLFLLLLLSFCFNWNTLEAKSMPSREQKECAGLDHNRFRYYSPEEGLYISQDPIGLAGGDRFYGYVKDPNMRVDPLGLSSTCIIDDKIRSQMDDRGWTDDDIQNLHNTAPTGTSTDKRRPNKTPDGLGRDDTASVYGSGNEYIVVNDRTNEVVQISDRNDSGWIPDGRITWNNNSTNE